MSARTEDLSTLLARIPDPEIRSLFSPEFILCCEQFDRFTTDMVLNLVRELGLEGPLAQGATSSELVRRMSFAPRAEVPIAWFLRKLAEADLLEMDGGSAGGAPRFRSRGPLPAGDPDRAQARAEAIDPRSIPPFTVVRAMVEHVPAFLRGEKTGEEILFSPAKLPLWFDYFSNDNLLYAINNRLGAEAVVRALPADRAATIVELGGGSGSAALAVAERLARDAALPRIERYVFSEVVPTFLRRAERACAGASPLSPWSSCGSTWTATSRSRASRPGIADVVYAVNTVHIAKDLAATLARIRETLKPGGTAVFSECVRPFDGQPIYVEFVFNFLENFTGVATDAATRPNHGFLTPENWRRAFHAAGFEEPRILPDVEELARHYDAFFVAAVSATGPGNEGTFRAGIGVATLSLGTKTGGPMPRPSDRFAPAPGRFPRLAAALAIAGAALIFAPAPRAAAQAPCVANATTLCLNASRFKVQVTWQVPSQGTSGVGTGIALTGDTGEFWFFSANNIELVVKVVDGRAFNNKFWVFYGALSNVQYTITVTDTQTGVVKTYDNPRAATWRAWRTSSRSENPRSPLDITAFGT